MKSPILYPLLLATLFACNTPSKQPAPTPIGPAKNHLEGHSQSSPVIQDYLTFLRSLDTTELTVGAPALQEFKQRFKGQPSGTSDTGVLLFYTLMQHLNTDTLELKKLLGEYPLDSLGAAEEYGEPMSAMGRKIHDKLLTDLFLVKSDEGNAYLIPSWRTIGPEVSSYVSQPMKELIAQNVKEDSDGWTNDAGLMMGPQHYAHNACWWENFLTRYPHHIYASQASNTYHGYLTMMVTGIDNTPLLDFDSTNKLSPYFDTVYQVINTEYPGSRTNTVIIPFRLAVQTRDTTTMKRIRDSLGNLPVH